MIDQKRHSKSQSDHANHLLSIWASFIADYIDGLGYSRNTVIGRLQRGEEVSHIFRSELPRGLMLRGFRVYQRVEHVLEDLGDGYRLVCAVEFGVLRPEGEQVRSSADRATLVGVSADTYRRRLRTVRKRLVL